VVNDSSKNSGRARTDIKLLNLTTINQLMMSKNVRCCHYGTVLQYTGKRQKLIVCVTNILIFQHFIIMEHKRTDFYVGMNCILT
jgi:hypothetical protein